MAAKKTRPKQSSKKASTVEPPTKPYSCKNPPPEGPMGLDQTTNLLKTDPAFAFFMAGLLCRVNSGDPNAPACLAAFFEPTDGELAKLCIPAGQYSKYQKCTEQSILISPIAYGEAGKKGFRPKKR